MKIAFLIIFTVLSDYYFSNVSENNGSFTTTDFDNNYAHGSELVVLDKLVNEELRLEVTPALAQFQHQDFEVEVPTEFSFHPQNETIEPTTKSNPLKPVENNYWDLVYSIESKQGRLLYRPRNKSKNCTWTTGPCGHHQLTVKALKDIGCNSMQCRKDRLIFSKSLAMSKKLLALNEKRLKKHGVDELDDYQRYLIHQQGATGIKNILAATTGKKTLSKNIKRNMANNSPYSYSEFKKMGSQLAAVTFMNHWKEKWEKEHFVMEKVNFVENKTIPKDQIADNLIRVPTFSESEIELALNYRF